MKKHKLRLFNWVPRGGLMYHPLIHSLPHIFLASSIFLQNLGARGGEKARIILTMKRVIEELQVASSKGHSSLIKLVMGQNNIADELFETMAVNWHNY